MAYFMHFTFPKVKTETQTKRFEVSIYVKGKNMNKMDVFKSNGASREKKGTIE